ncbi:leucine-rich repeat protein [Anaerostipes sp.]|uniref:leucine-rich repeat protein n=1 Tax=Anaerostipes sp. TaxID=1872530 RepID=UPI0025C324D7|nr:leucine-rich repeat protein [Anaerostipes sp.]MBS7006879.1 leucine-rich repeat protein [Anaerostipes sp.]
MRKIGYIKIFASFAVSALMLLGSAAYGPVPVKAQTLQEQDSAPGILESDDFDTPAEYEQYMKRLHTYKDYQYKIEKDSKEKNGYKLNIKRYTGPEQSISVPSKILSTPVRTISSGTFKNKTGLKKIKVPESIYTIQKGAFSGCKAKIKKPSFLKKQKNGSYTAIAQVKIPKKGKNKKVNYKASKVTKITASKKSIKLKKGKKKKIYTRVYISGKKKQGYLDYSILKFTSSNKKVVKVSKYGNIKALKKGKATIKVKLRISGKSYKIKVKVTK